MPVTVVPSALVMVMDLASMLAIVPRISIGTTGGASAAKPDPAPNTKAEANSNERNFIGVSPKFCGGNAHQFPPRRKTQLFSLSRSEERRVGKSVDFGGV